MRHAFAPKATRRLCWGSLGPAKTHHHILAHLCSHNRIAFTTSSVYHLAWGSYALRGHIITYEHPCPHVRIAFTTSSVHPSWRGSLCPTKRDRDSKTSHPIYITVLNTASPSPHHKHHSPHHSQPHHSFSSLPQDIPVRSCSERMNIYDHKDVLISRDPMHR